MDKLLYLITGYEIAESENYSDKAKVQLITWLNEATESQVKAFLLDGKIVRLNEQEEESVNDRFEISEVGGRIAKLRKSWSSQAGSGAGMNVFWLAYRKLRSMFSACTKRCGTYEVNTSRRQHCMIKCKVQQAQGEIAAAKKANNAAAVQKASAKLAKANAALSKSQASFGSRGADR
ncbi:MAG: hypothetical protein GOV02_03215 [Candidatus Aenigmarchaeota archaeon]|nr:hypothetical protein [Candidatus Aenigmarchaeota archaeon]